MELLQAYPQLTAEQMSKPISRDSRGVVPERARNGVISACWELRKQGRIESFEVGKELFWRVVA